MSLSDWQYNQQRQHEDALHDLDRIKFAGPPEDDYPDEPEPDDDYDPVVEQEQREAQR